jgi:predicted dehydrogenase
MEFDPSKVTSVRIGFKGQLLDEPAIRAGFIGCGSHAFRNLYPALQFAPVELVAVCDLKIEKAQAFAAKFGAQHAYADYRSMLDQERLDAVFICTGYDAKGRPLYPLQASDCLQAGCHVWMEKPPAASCAEIDAMRAAATKAGKNVMVGLKKMFFPANEKARELMCAPDFGRPSLALLQYPQYVPTRQELVEYIEGGKPNASRWFLDHLCHPASLMIFLLGMPSSMHYQRSAQGAGVATFQFNSGAMASIALTSGSSVNGGMERTVIVSDSGRHITVENNLRVTLHKLARLGYGDEPSFYVGSPAEASAVWEPEFSLGQLYNKGLFLLGYCGEISEFARSVLERRPPAKGTLEHAWQVTRIFEGFAEGPGKEIAL